jgi:hypothetical protein
MRRKDPVCTHEKKSKKKKVYYLTRAKDLNHCVGSSTLRTNGHDLVLM